MTGYDLTNVYQGGDYSIILQALDVNNNPINLSGYSINACIKEKYSSPTGITYFSGSLLTGESGVFQLYLNHTQTSGLSVKTYVYNVQAVNISINNYLNLFGGYLNINPTNFSYYTTGSY
jgi:hypothetical protein